MGIFEYVSVLTSIIVGLGIAHLLRGVAQIIQHPGRVKLYWVHLLWTLYMFCLAVFWWWWEFRLSRVETWTFEEYLFLVSNAVVVFMLCAILFPSDLDGYSGFEDYFLSRRRWFFGLNAASYLIDVVDASLHLEQIANVADYSPTQYVIATLVSVLICIAAMVTKNRRFHGGLVVLALLYFVAYGFRTYESYQ